MGERHPNIRGGDAGRPALPQGPAKTVRRVRAPPVMLGDMFRHAFALAAASAVADAPKAAAAFLAAGAAVGAAADGARR